MHCPNLHCPLHYIESKEPSVPSHKVNMRSNPKQMMALEFQSTQIQEMQDKTKRFNKYLITISENKKQRAWRRDEIWKIISKNLQQSSVCSGWMPSSLSQPPEAQVRNPFSRVRAFSPEEEACTTSAQFGSAGLMSQNMPPRKGRSWPSSGLTGFEGRAVLS